MVYLSAQVCPVIVSPTNVTATAPPQLSLAVTLLVSGAGTALAHCTVTGPGQVRLGGVVSFTTIVCEQELEMVSPPVTVSVAVQIRVIVFPQLEPCLDCVSV